MLRFGIIIKSFEPTEIDLRQSGRGSGARVSAHQSPLWVISRHTATTFPTSAFRGKADINQSPAEGPLVAIRRRSSLDLRRVLNRQCRRGASPLATLVASPVIALAVSVHEKFHKGLNFRRYKALVGMHSVKRRPVGDRRIRRQNLDELPVCQCWPNQPLWSKD